MEFLNRMHRASNERGGSEEYKKPLFKETYGDSRRSPAPVQEPREDPPETAPETPAETTTPEPAVEEPTGTVTPETQSPPPQPRKMSREEKNLQSDLGDYWRCTDHDPHYDGQIGRRLRTRVTKLTKNNEVPMEEYWILEDETDKSFQEWKSLYKKTEGLL